MMHEKHKEIFRHRAQFWAEDRNIVWLLSALTCYTFILYPLVSILGSRLAIQIIQDLFFLVVLLSGLFALTHHKFTRMIFTGIIVIVISIHLIRFASGANFLLGLDIAVSMLTVIAFVIFLLMYVFKEGPVTWHRIQGAVAAYLLIAIAFSIGYNLIFFLIPGAFKFPDEVPDIGDPGIVNIFYYFSVTTVTTMGYGDITPVHPMARTLAMIEAYLGHLFPTITLARLVSLHIVHSSRGDK